MKMLVVTVLTVISITGCGVNTTFIYKPSPPAPHGRNLPIKLAVLPFADGTEHVSTGGSILAENVRYNLARVGISHRITALTPALWAKAFTDETRASGDFREVRFLYDASELTGEEYRIEGTVEKAFATGYQGKPNEFAVRIRAIRRSDELVVWEKGFSRTWVQDEEMFGSCSVFNHQCVTDLDHGDFNRAMREIFAEARTDLVRTLAPLSGSRVEKEGNLHTSPKPESIEETIRAILKEER